MTNDETLEDHLDAIMKAIHLLKTVPKKIIKTEEYKALDFEPQDDILWAIEQLKKAGDIADEAFYNTINQIL